MTSNKNCLLQIKIVVANQTTVPVVSVGETQITTCVNNSQYDVIVKNVLYIVRKLAHCKWKLSSVQERCLIYNQASELIGCKSDKWCVQIKHNEI